MSDVQERRIISVQIRQVAQLQGYSRSTKLPSVSLIQWIKTYRRAVILFLFHLIYSFRLKTSSVDG